MKTKSLEPYQSRTPITNFEVVQNSVVSYSACVVCEVSDRSVSGCSGIDCFLSFHQECLDIELDTSNSSSSEEEGLANPYCPYCCFNTLGLREYASLSGDECNGYSETETEDEYYTGELRVRDEVEVSDDETRVNTSLSGGDDDDNGYSVDTTEVISDQEELQGAEDDACSSKVHVDKDTRLSGGDDDDNECSVDTTEVISDQEELQGDQDDACSSKVLLDNDSEKSNMTLLEETESEEEQVIGEVEASEEETTEIISDQEELQGDKDDACSSKVHVDKDTRLSGYDDDSGYSVDTTEIVSDQEELQGDEDDAYSSKVLLDNDSEKSNMTLVEDTDAEEESEVEVLDEETAQDQTRVNTDLSGDENGFSMNTRDIVSDQMELQGDKDDACSSIVLLDNDSDQPNKTLVEETDSQVIDEVEASEEEETAQDETTEIRSDQELQGDKDSDKSNMPLVEETNPEEYNSLKAIDSEISSNESSNKSTGEDVTQVAKSKTVRDTSSSNKDQRRKIRCTSEEEETLKDKRFGSGVSTTDFDKRNVPHKKRHYVVTASEGSEMLHNSVPKKCVTGLFGLGCLVSFNEEHLNAELGSSYSIDKEDPENSYCAYCWFHILAARYMAVVGSEIEDFEFPNFSCDDDSEYSLDTTEIVSDQELQGDNDGACSSKVHIDKDTNDDNGYSVDTTEIVSGQELHGDEDDACSSKVHVDKDTNDDNGYSVDTTEIVSGQELHGDEDDACSSSWEQVQVDKDYDQSKITLGEETDPEEEQVIDEVEALDDETAQDNASVNATIHGGENGYSVDTTEIISDPELQGDKNDACSSNGEQVQVNNDSDKSGMPLVEETDTEEYYIETLQVIDEVESLDDETGQDQSRVNRCAAGERNGSGKENDQVQPNENRRQRRRRRRRIALEAIDSEVSSNESTNEPTGEDVTQVAKSNTMREISFFNRRRRILWTSEEVEMLKVGVKKYAAEVKLNIPWRKILEMGKNVFHETRNPDSLKDKWRNLMRAGSSN